MFKTYSDIIFQKECPSEWSEWSQCDKSCGGGHSIRTRFNNGYVSRETYYVNLYIIIYGKTSIKELLDILKSTQNGATGKPVQ